MASTVLLDNQIDFVNPATETRNYLFQATHCHLYAFQCYLDNDWAWSEFGSLHFIIKQYESVSFMHMKSFGQNMLGVFAGNSIQHELPANLDHTDLEF